jgi:hypothetical protein
MPIIILILIVVAVFYFIVLPIMLFVTKGQVSTLEQEVMELKLKVQ